MNGTNQSNKKACIYTQNKVLLNLEFYHLLLFGPVMSYNENLFGTKLKNFK